MKSKAPAIPYLIWMLFFTVVPLVMVVYYAYSLSVKLHNVTLKRTDTYSYNYDDYASDVDELYTENICVGSAFAE